MLQSNMFLQFLFLLKSKHVLLHTRVDSMEQLETALKFANLKILQEKDGKEAKKQRTTSLSTTRERALRFLLVTLLCLERFQSF